MGRFFKYLLIVVILLALIGYSYFKSKAKFKSLKISQNSVVVNDFEMSKTVSENEFYVIKADNAKYNNEMSDVLLDNCTVTYKKDTNILEFKSDVCEYLIDKKIFLRGKIKGHYNEVKFESKDNISCEYDLKKQFAKLNGEVAFRQNENYIKAKRIYFYNRKSKVVFENDVEVIYETDSF